MHSVRPLLRLEWDRALAVAARAFHEDPLFTHIYPDAASREARFARENRVYLRWIYEPIGLAETIGDVEGLALWLPSEAFRQVGWRELACLPTLARAVGLPHLLRARRAYKAFDPFIPTGGPFWYLGLLAVAPKAQGCGLGSALLRAGLQRAHRQPVYLETGTRENVAFYESHGFRVMHEIPLPDGGPLHWGLWRDP